MATYLRVKFRQKFGKKFTLKMRQMIFADIVRRARAAICFRTEILPILTHFDILRNLISNWFGLVCMSKIRKELKMVYRNLAAEFSCLRKIFIFDENFDF